VFAAILLVEDFGQKRPELRRFAKRFLDPDELGVGERIVEIVAQHFPRERRHETFPGDGVSIHNERSTTGFHTRLRRGRS
jgi:hypothetical protein